MVSNQIYIRILVFFMVVRVIMAIGLIKGFPYIQSQDDVYLSSYEVEFFRLAKGLSEFHPIKTFTTLGYPLFLVPFIWLFRAKVIEDILLAVTMFHSIFLFGISIFLIASIAKMLSNGNKKVALISAGLWVILPYLLHLIVLFRPQFGCIDVAQKRTFYLIWPALMDNSLFSFLIILGIYTFLKFLKDRERVFYVFIVGALFGFAALVNPLIVTVIGISFILTFLFMKQLKAFFYSTITFGIFSIPQLIYNWHFNGSPFNFLGISAERIKVYNNQAIPWLALSNSVFSLNRIKERFAMSTPALIILLLLMLISITYILKKRDASKILLIWILPYLFFIIFYSGFSFSILECLLSILPAIIIMFSIIMVDMGDYLYKWV